MNVKVEAQLAEFVIRTRLSDIPPEVIGFAKSLMLKTIAGLACGAAKPTGRKMAEIVRSHNAGADVRVIKCDFRTSLWESVFLHSYLAHASELEDDRNNGGTSWDITVIPLLLSLGEKLQLSGKAFTEALVAGLEVHTRTCLFGAEHMGLSLVPGAIGPAVAAAKAMGLNREQTTAAMGLGMSCAPLAFSNYGTDAHFLESSLQALHGLMAAEMAKQGLTGNPDITTYLSNFLGADKVISEKMVDQLGKKWILCEIWIKKYPCCFRTHRQVDMLLGLMKEHGLRYDEIASVDAPISTSDALLNRPEPRTEGDLQFSMQHILGAAMLDGDVNLDNINDDAATDSRFRNARRKVNVFTDPSLPRPSRSAPARITLKTNQGEAFPSQRMYPIGAPQDPLSAEQIRKLYFKFGRGALTEKQLQSAAEAIDNLDQLGSMTELTDILMD